MYLPLAANYRVPPIFNEVLTPLPTGPETILTSSLAEEALKFSPWLLATALVVLLITTTLIYYRRSFIPSKKISETEYLKAIDQDHSLELKLNNSTKNSTDLDDVAEIDRHG